MSVRNWGVALVLAWGCLACDDAPPRVEARPVPRATPPEDDRPTGYPNGFPLVNGGRVLEGAVDEGVIRTSSLEYATPCATLEASLRAAFTEVGARVVAKTTLEDGSVSIRASQLDQEASFSMREALERCVLRTIASDRPRIGSEIRQ